MKLLKLKWRADPTPKRMKPPTAAVESAQKNSFLLVVYSHRLWIFLFCIAILLGGIRLKGAYHALSGRLVCPVQVQKDEALIVDDSLCFMQGSTPYVDFRAGGPYVLCNYPPLYLSLQAFFIKSGLGLFTAGRWISFISFLFILCLLIYWGTRRWSFLWILLLPIWLLASPTWEIWASVDRCDVLMIALNFFALSLWVFSVEPALASNRFRGWETFSVGLFHAAALLVKQTAWPLGVAAMIVLVHRRRWKELFLFCMGAFIPPLLVVSYLEKSTQGMFLNHTLFGAAGAFDYDVFRQLFLGSWVRECGLLFLLTIVVLRWGTKQLDIVKIIFWFQTASLASLGRVFGAENYYLEFFLISVVVIAEGSRLEPGAEKPQWFPFLSASGAVLISTSFAFGMGYPFIPSPSDVSAKQQAAYIMTGRGPVLALDPDLVLMTGRTLWYQPSSFAFQYRLKKWDPAILVKSTNMALWNGSRFMTCIISRCFHRLSRKPSIDTTFPYSKDGGGFS